MYEGDLGRLFRSIAAAKYVFPHMRVGQIISNALTARGMAPGLDLFHMDSAGIADTIDRYAREESEARGRIAERDEG